MEAVLSTVCFRPCVCFFTCITQSRNFEPSQSSRAVCSLCAVQYGSFVGPKTVRVEGVDYTADHILVAVGGMPTVPTVEGAEHCISSNGFFELEVSHCFGR